MTARLCLAAASALFCIGTLCADEFTGTLVKIHDNKVTFSTGKGRKKKTTTLPADDKCLVTAAKYDAKTKKIEAGDTIPGGLKNARFEKIEPDTIDAWIRTDASNEKIVELRLFQSIAKKK